MKHLVSFFVIILITFSFNNAKSQDQLVAYIDMEKVMNETVAGKSLIQQLEKIHKKNSEQVNRYIIFVFIFYLRVLLSFHIIYLWFF